MFNSSDTIRWVSVPIVDDTLAERIEQFSLTLIPATEGPVALSPGRERATVELSDNDCKRTQFHNIS